MKISITVLRNRNYSVPVPTFDIKFIVKGESKNFLKKEITILSVFMRTFLFHFITVPVPPRSVIKLRIRVRNAALGPPRNTA